MKKILLSVVALMATVSMSAQVETCAIDPATSGANADGVELAAGTELGKSESVTCTVTFTDTYKANDNKTKFTVNGADFDLNGKGIQGSTNGPKSSWQTGDYPENGCVYHFVPSKDGYLYIIHKGSQNKNYVVYEEKARIPYIYSMLTTDANSNITVGGYDLSKIDGATEEVEGIVNVKSDYQILTPMAYNTSLDINVGNADKAKYNGGNSVIKFPVFEGLAYDVMACGSKMTLGGFIFDTAGDATIVSGETTILDKGAIPGASTNINVVKDNVIDINSAIYNIAGQKVANDFKGLVIKNGKKMIQK